MPFDIAAWGIVALAVVALAVVAYRDRLHGKYVSAGEFAHSPGI